MCGVTAALAFAPVLVATSLVCVPRREPFAALRFDRWLERHYSASMWRPRDRKKAGRRKIMAGAWRGVASSSSGARPEPSTSLQITRKPFAAFREALFAGGETPADESFALGPECTAGREP